MGNAATSVWALPALIAIVTDPAGALVGLQRTYLTEDGRKASTTPTASDRKPKVKYSLGNVAGGAIQLGPPSDSIIVTEGLEDAEQHKARLIGHQTVQERARAERAEWQAMVPQRAAGANRRRYA